MSPEHIRSPSDPDLDVLLEFATRTASTAGGITLEHFGSAAVEFKGDGSEVTAADRAAEEYIRSAIAETFPEHGVFGEEGANVSTSGRYRWIVDPIDGTRSFACGVPLYGVLLCLERDGTPLVGCCHFPALGDTVVAAVGGGCWWNGRRAEVSGVERLEEARVVTSGLEYWRDWATEESRSGFERLVGHARFARTWGDCFGYALVATGRAEILADPACGAHWDYAPMVPILAEAGGRFTTLSGSTVSSWSSALASNGRVHEAASRLWGGLSDEALQTDTLRRRRADA
jgi:histidinol-phosphatase